MPLFTSGDPHMSFFDLFSDPEARYALAYSFALCIPWTLAVILYYRIKYRVK
jgi:hypothetical protein